MMPKKDGLELTKILKDDERSSHIPIIIITARVEDKDRFTGLQYGADAYLTKPFKKEELLIRVEQLILLRKKLQKSYTKGFMEQANENITNNKEAIFLNKVIAIIKEDISNVDLNAQYIASRTAMSESQLYRKIKALSGQSTAVYIRSIRLHYAKQLIETTDQRISEIAYDCGFTNPAWFTKNFKESFGMTPSDLRS
jgi:YesN/AraC family two-component response regulator